MKRNLFLSFSMLVVMVMLSSCKFGIYKYVGVYEAEYAPDPEHSPRLEIGLNVYENEGDSIMAQLAIYHYFKNALLFTDFAETSDVQLLEDKSGITVNFVLPADTTSLIERERTDRKVNMTFAFENDTILKLTQCDNDKVLPVKELQFIMQEEPDTLPQLEMRYPHEFNLDTYGGYLVYGPVKSVVDARGNIEYKFDENGHIKEIKSPYSEYKAVATNDPNIVKLIGKAQNEYTNWKSETEYTYENDRLIKIEDNSIRVDDDYATHEVIDYKYDARGRLVHTVKNGDILKNYVENFLRDDQGMTKFEVYDPKDVHEIIDTDKYGNVVRYKEKFSTTQIYNRKFEYYDTGKPMRDFSAPKKPQTAEEKKFAQWEGTFMDDDENFYYDNITITIEYKEGGKFTGEMVIVEGREDHIYQISAALEGETMVIRQLSGRYEGSDEDGAYSGRFKGRELKTGRMTKNGDQYTLKYEGQTFGMKLQ